MPTFQFDPLPLARSPTPALAVLSRPDFALAQQRLCAFRRWRDYEEFEMERDALYLGYEFAGVSAQLQPVPLEAFGRWTRLTGAAANLDALDEFAAHWRWRADNPEAHVIGRFGRPGVPEREVCEGAGVQSVRVRPEAYTRWRHAFARLGLFAPPDLDAYATRAVECCIDSARGARRPAVSSS